jgi:hypothetical protein
MSPYFLTLMAIMVMRKQKMTRMRTVVARIFSRQVRPLSRLVDLTLYLDKSLVTGTVLPNSICETRCLEVKR